MIRDVVVTVPAADEQDEIAGCLLALRRAVDELHQRTSLRGHIVVALDDCRDATAEIVARFPEVHTVDCAARCVGAARQRAVDVALARWGPPEQVWLASTDADCRVPHDWLTQMALAADRGVDVVLGTVRPGRGLAAAVEQAWYDAHVLDDGHLHVHGANMGLSASAYMRVGGWRDLPAHEDIDLVHRAIAAGEAVARSGAAPVETSTRLVGRAPEGFAAFLQALHSDLPAVS